MTEIDPTGSKAEVEICRSETCFVVRVQRVEIAAVVHIAVVAWQLKQLGTKPVTHTHTHCEHQQS